MGADYFGQAAGHVSGLQGAISSAIAGRTASANAQITSAVQSIRDVGRTVDQLLVKNTNPPTTPSINVDVSADSIDAPSAADFGANAIASIIGTIAQPPKAPDVRITPPKQFRDLPDVGFSAPSTPNLDRPVAPGSAPQPPEMRHVAYDRPNSPVMPLLEHISLPSFTPSPMPIFDATAPEFAGSSANTILNWVEPTFAPEILVLEEGDLGLPAEVEAALYERAAAREDRIIAKDISEALIEFSSKGFTMPSGMLAAKVDAIRSEGELRKLGAQREILIKATDVRIENARFAVQHSLATAQLLANLHENAAKRLFEADKATLDAGISMYNAQVSLFNAAQSAYATRAQVHKSLIEARAVEADVFKAQLQAEISRGQVNEQRVRLYEAQWRSVQVAAEAYRTEVEAAKAEVEAGRAVIEGYRASVDAYAARISANKAEVETYTAQVQAEGVKASTLQAMAQALTAQVGAETARIEAENITAKAQLASFDGELKAYIAAQELVKLKVLATGEAVKANIAAFEAQTKAYAADAEAKTSVAKVDLAAREAESRLAVALYDVEVKAWEADMRAATSKAGMALEASKAAAQTSSTLAAGLMAGMNLGMSVSGSGSISGQGVGSVSESTSTSTGKSKNMTIEGTPADWAN